MPMARNFFSTTPYPFCCHFFRHYVSTKSPDQSKTIKISSEVKEWLLKERARGEQAKLESLRNQVMLEGPPRPGDRFYEASWKILAWKLRKKDE